MILKTRKHNDNPELMVVELYSDDGVYVADQCSDVTLSSMQAAMWDLMKEHKPRTAYCTAEELIESNDELSSRDQMINHIKYLIGQNYNTTPRCGDRYWSVITLLHEFSNGIEPIKKIPTFDLMQYDYSKLDVRQLVRLFERVVLLFYSQR